jgi:hypothetical protein
MSPSALSRTEFRFGSDRSSDLGLLVQPKGRGRKIGKGAVGALTPTKLQQLNEELAVLWIDHHGDGTASITVPIDPQASH